MLRALGSGAGAPWASLEALPGGRSRLVVVARAARGGSVADPEIAGWVRDAKHLAKLDHPNVARVRDVVIRSDEILVVSDFVDGVRWSELGGERPAPPLETALRVVVDVLSGLAALEGLRDEKGLPLLLVHGAIAPEQVVVGADGISRILAAPPPGRIDDGQSGYLAPELLLEDESADPRADTYSVGVMLWEILSGARLFPGLKATAIVTQLLSGRVPLASPRHGEPWSQPLVDVAARAISPEPERRFESAAAFAAEIRRVAGARLRSAEQVAVFVRQTHGDRIATRRADFERGEARAGVTRVTRPLSLADEVPVEELEELEADEEAPPEVGQTASAGPPVLHTPPAGSGSLATWTGVASTDPPDDELLRPVRRRQRRMILATAVAVIAAASAFTWWLRASQSAGRPQATVADVASGNRIGAPSQPPARTATSNPASAPTVTSVPVGVPAAPPPTIATQAVPATPPPQGPVSPPSRARPGPRKHYEPEGI